MPPRPISSRTSSWGKSLAMASTGGGTKPAFPPPSLPEAVPKPAFIRHSGQIPCGASAASDFPQLGHVRVVSITVYLPVSEGSAGAMLQEKAWCVVRGACYWSTREHGEQVVHFLIHLAGISDGVGDFLPQQLAVTLAQAVDRHFDGALG